MKITETETLYSKKGRRDAVTPNASQQIKR